MTIIELIAILVVLGIIAAIAIPTIGSLMESSKYKADIAELSSLNDASRLYVFEQDNNQEEIFIDCQTDQERIEMLVDLGYLTKIAAPRIEGANYT